MMGFYNAVLSMQLRRWLAEPEKPRAMPTRRVPPPTDIDFRDPLDDPGEGGAGARVPRRPRAGPFHPPAAVEPEEPDWLAELDADEMERMVTLPGDATGHVDIEGEDRVA